LFGSFLTAGGGKAGTNPTGGDGGSASGGDLNIPGGNGSQGISASQGGYGGGCFLGLGAQLKGSVTSAGDYGGGGSGNNTGSSGSGGNGFCIITEYIT